MKNKPTNKVNHRIDSLRRQIVATDWVVQGTLSRRTKVCGKPNCRCARDPAFRHGPYFEWTRREKGRFVHSIVTDDQAAKLAHAISNHKKVLKLLAQWCRETARVLKM